MSMKNMFYALLTCIFLLTYTCDCAPKKSKKGKTVVRAKHISGKKDIKVIDDIPLMKLQQTIFNVTNQTNLHFEKFDHRAQYAKYQSQLAQNYDKVIQLQSKFDILNQSLTTIFTTDPIMIQLQNEKLCVQAISNAIMNSRPVYLHEYRKQYQSIVTQLKSMYDSFNQAHPAKKFSVSVFGKQVEFRKKLNYSTVHQWINNTFETLKYANAWNQSIQLMFDNGTLVNNYNELALFGIKLHGMLEKNDQILNQINNKIESKISASSSKYQNVKNQLQTAIQQYNQTYQLFFDKIKYMFVYRHSRAMRLHSKTHQIRTIMLKLECTAFVYHMVRLYDPNIHNVSYIAELFDIYVNAFINGTRHTLKSPAITILNETFNENVVKKVSRVDQVTNTQLWRKDIIKSIEHKTKVLFQELFSDENCKVLNEMIADGIDINGLYLAQNLPFLLESARNKHEEYLSTMIDSVQYDMFNNQYLLPSISICMVHIENNTINTKYLIANVWDQYHDQDLPHVHSYQQLVDMHGKLRQEIDKNTQIMNDKIMVYLQSVNINDASFQDRTDMINWLFGDDYGVLELVKLATIKSILLYHHDTFADTFTANNVSTMSDSQIMGVFYLVQQQLMMYHEQFLYGSTLEIARQWYGMLNDHSYEQNNNVIEYMNSLEARFVGLGI